MISRIKPMQVFQTRPFISVFIIYFISILTFAFYYQREYQANRDSFNVANDILKKEIMKDNRNSIGQSLEKLNLEKMEDSLKISLEKEHIKILLEFFNDSTIFKNVYGGEILDEVFLNDWRFIRSYNIPFKLSTNIPYSKKLNFENPTYENERYSYRINFSNASNSTVSRIFLNFSINVYDKKTEEHLFGRNDLKYQFHRRINHYLTTNLHRNLIHDFKDYKLNEIDKLNYKIEQTEKEIVNTKKNLALDNDTLNYWDFFYFSVITQSSTGYGDILPNKRSIRMAVSIQIIISILLLTFILGYFLDNR